MSDAQANIITTPAKQIVAYRTMYFATGMLSKPVTLGGKQWAVVITIVEVYSDATLGKEKRKIVTFPDSQGVEDFLVYINTALPGETGGVLRRANYRLLTWLFDRGELPDVESITP